REHMEYARRLLETLPRELLDSASDPFGARAVIYGLLLDKNEEVQANQIAHLRSVADRPVFAATEKILPLMLTMNEEARLPLMDLSMPSLRSMSLEQFRKFEENVSSLVRIDERISIFEFILEHVVVRRLEKNFITPQHTVKEIESIQEVADDVSCVLTLLANIGHAEDDAAQAFAGAAATLDQSGATFRYHTKEECKRIRLGRVLNRLAQLNPKVKQTLITAFFQSLVHDKKITMKEAEFFRLLVYALETPLPPWIKI
ncbi:MAG: hypothetical protein R3297_06795, partial [Desulfobulbales bacterium]|nr:hypothetical protein [Desulfobulbales bacterium]